MASNIPQGAGKMIQVLPGDPNRVIFLLEESHAFTLGQVKSALILNRLYTAYGIPTIGLEGLAGGQTLDLAWAHRDPTYMPDKPITAREDVILQDLADNPDEVSLLSTIEVEISPLAYARQTNAIPVTLDFTNELPGTTEKVQAKAALDLKALNTGPVTLEERLLALRQALMSGKTTPAKGIGPAKWQNSSSDLWIQLTSP
jgi:hypothetical protein